ncbi:MAG: S8 family peptidase, partial [Chloroflexota bacterium]
TGSASTVVAVIDTGILNHTDLVGKTVPGYDFISDIFTANDGNGRDNNPADPGDWVTANACGAGSSARNSSWHGTHVAGTIGAASNNNLGVTGVDWNAKILPVRVLGRCGGFISDIVDGMRWSAGLAVAGVPANGNPADVLNLSLGGSGACSVTEQNAINAIVTAGATIVIAAGNEDDNAANYSPGNCNNVITVAATDKSGDRAYYSNYGSIIEVSGPGGAQSFANDPNGVLSTLDSGTTTPANDNAYVFNQGTSMATPHVAGLASLIKGMRPGYTQAQVLSLLQSTARAFPAGSTCNTSICGAGIVDAYQALNVLNVTFTDFVYLPAIIKAEPPPVVSCVPQSGESNNISDALTTCSGHTATGQVSAADRDDVYKLQMTANQHLTINMTGSGGDADLYLYPPGTTDVNTDPYSARSINTGNTEAISGQVLTSGYWYIDVYSYDGTTSYSVTATVSNALTGEMETFLLMPENMESGSRLNK